MKKIDIQRLEEGTKVLGAGRVSGIRTTRWRARILQRPARPMKAAGCRTYRYVAGEGRADRGTQSIMVRPRPGRG